jgi:uncharacterized RDD family membrane protein YckC
MVYDCVVLFGILALGTMPFLPFVNGKVLVPAEVGALAYVYWAWEAGLCSLFFAYFWTRPRAQTLGMQAWRLRVERDDGSRVDWPVALRKIALVWILILLPVVGYWRIWHDWPKSSFAIATVMSLAPLVAAYTSIWMSRDKLTWHDRWTRTRVVVLPKQ